MPRQATPLAPLTTVVAGILLVAIDLNLQSLDILPDPIGYALVAWGLFRVAGQHPAFGWGALAAAVGVVTSTLGVFLRRLEEGQIVEHPLVTAADALIEAVIVIAVCTALIALSHDPRVTGPARTLRIALPALSLVGVLLPLALSPLAGRVLEAPTVSLGAEGAAAGLIVVAAIALVVAGIALGIWFLVVLWRAAKEPRVGWDDPATTPAATG